MSRMPDAVEWGPVHSLWISPFADGYSANSSRPDRRRCRFLTIRGSNPGRLVLVVTAVIADLAVQGGLQQHLLGQLLGQPALRACRAG